MWHLTCSFTIKTARHLLYPGAFPSGRQSNPKITSKHLSRGTLEGSLSFLTTASSILSSNLTRPPSTKPIHQSRSHLQSHIHNDTATFNIHLKFENGLLGTPYVPQDTAAEGLADTLQVSSRGTSISTHARTSSPLP